MTSRASRTPAVVAITLGLMALFGHLPFTDAMTDGLVRIADRVGVHGDEGIEDLYLAVTAAISLLLALLIVAVAERRWASGRGSYRGR